MSRRFFCQPPIRDDRVELSGAEAHHLIHVMRAQVAQQVVLFDGTGREYQAIIEQIQRKTVRLRIASAQDVDRELPFCLSLAVALPRGDRQDWLVQKAVELGVTRLIPWQTERSVARPNDKTLARLQRVVVEASKQCGRNRLMAIESECEYQDYVSRPLEGPALLAHPGANAVACRSITDWLCSNRFDAIHLGIGPEGGLTDAEADRAIHAGWRLVELGPRILRTETAALALIAQVSLLVSSQN